MKYSIVLPILLLGIIIILCGVFISSMLFIIVGSICIIIGLVYVYLSTPTPPTVLSVTYTSVPTTVGYLTVTCSSVLFATLYQAIAFCPTSNYTATSTHTTLILPISDYGTYRVYVQAITPFGTSFYSSDTSLNLITITAPPKIPCTVSDWSQWSSCNSNNGIQTRTRTVITPEQNGGGSCPLLIDTSNCPVACVVSEWSAWGPCSAPCSTQPESDKPPIYPSQYRTRSIVIEPLNDGALCPPELSQSQTCNTTDCPTYCQKYKYECPPGIAQEWVNICERTSGTMIGYPSC
jgi:hypothetical protein